MKACETCKWFEPANRVWPAGCANSRVWRSSAEQARDPDEDCGPSGRYWEPRESEE